MTESHSVTRYEWAPSAAKHGVAHARARHVLDTAPTAFPVADEDGEPDPDLLLFLGDDPNGVPLEIVVRLLGDDAVRIFHVMPMRPKYRPLYDQMTR
jgi:hypothetical protein